MRKHIVANIPAYSKEAAMEFQKVLDDGYEIINSVAIGDCVQYVLCKNIITDEERKVQDLMFKAKSIGLPPVRNFPSNLDDIGLPIDLPKFPEDRSTKKLINQ